MNATSTPGTFREAGELERQQRRQIRHSVRPDAATLANPRHAPHRVLQLHEALAEVSRANDLPV